MITISTYILQPATKQTTTNTPPLPHAWAKYLHISHVLLGRQYVFNRIYFESKIRFCNSIKTTVGFFCILFFFNLHFLFLKYFPSTSQFFMTPSQLLFFYLFFIVFFLFRSSKSFHVALIDFPKFPEAKKNFQKKKKKITRRSILIVHWLERIPTCTFLFCFFLHITPHQSEPNNVIFMTEVLITTHEEWTPADVKEFSDKRIKKRRTIETVVTDEGDSTKKGVICDRLFLGKSQRSMNANICVLFTKR